jgi:hypothetical protein
MDQRTHRILAAVTAGIAGLGGLLALTDPASLGVSADTWNIVGNWLSFVGGIAAVAVTGIRQVYGTAPTGP